MNLRKTDGVRKYDLLPILVIIIAIVKSGNGQSEEEIKRSSPSKPELSPCQTAALLPVIRNEFQKIIPVFSPETFSITLNSELKLKGTDRVLSPFLIRYYTLVISTINQLEARKARTRNPMLLVFNGLYLNFLTQTGVPLTCVSFYSGASAFSSVSQVRQLTAKLEKRFGPPSPVMSAQPSAGHKSGPNHFGALGRDLASRLRLSPEPFNTPTGTEPNNNNYGPAPACETIFLRLQDGSILTNLPSVSVPPESIKIPGEPNPIKTQRTNVTFLLSKYFSAGLGCLDTPALKGNFSTTFCSWISAKLIPTLLGSSSCVPGFPGILSLMKSIDLLSLETQNNVNMLQQQPGGAAYGQFAEFKQPPPPQSFDFGEYAPLQQGPVEPAPSPDTYQNEVYKLSPKFNYRLKDAEDEWDDGYGYGADALIQESTTESIKAHVVAAAGIGTILLFIVICCVFPLVYFLCPPSTKNVRRGKERLFKYLRKKIPPAPADRRRRHEEQSTADEEEPLVQRSILKKSRPHKATKRTTVNVKLNESQVAEISFDETSGTSSDELDYATDEFGVGTQKPSKPLPATHTYDPGSNGKSCAPAPKAKSPAFETEVSGDTTGPELNEDEIYSRYDKGPKVDLAAPASRRLDTALKTSRPPVPPRPKAPPYFPDSTASTRPQTPAPPKSSSVDFFENHMVEWPDD